MSEHARMVDILWKDASILARALHIPNIWFVGKECPLDPTLDDRVDIVFRDRFEPRKVSGDAICYVVELKSDKANHEVLGQLKKATNAFQKKGEAIGHWKNTVGVAIAKKFTPSALQLLNDEGYSALLWRETETKVSLSNLTGEFK